MNEDQERIEDLISEGVPSHAPSGASTTTVVIEEAPPRIIGVQTAAPRIVAVQEAALQSGDAQGTVDEAPQAGAVRSR